MKHGRPIGIASILPVAIAPAAFAQGTAADYERTNGLRKKYEGLVGSVLAPPAWTKKDRKTSTADQELQ